MDSLISFWFQHQHRLATLTCLVLVVLLMATLVQTTLFVLDNLEPATPLPQRGQSTSAKTKPASQINLRELSLFGRASKQATVPKSHDAPETKLNLELHGVFLSDAAKKSAAIIGQKNKGGELYQIGDTISGGAVLEAVYEDHILIRRGARLEKLMFSEDAMTSSASSTVATRNRVPTPAQGGSTNQSRLSQIRQRIEDRRNDRTGQPSPGSAMRTYIESHRDAISQDPQAALTQLGVTPVQEGQAKGYALGAANPALTRAGLKSGDVILSVNGKPVGVAMDDSALIDSALQQKRVRVEIQRDTRRFFLTVPIH